MEREVWVASLSGIDGVCLDFRGDSAEINIGVFSYWSPTAVIVESEVCTQYVTRAADLAPVIRTHLLGVEAARTRGARPEAS